MTNYFQFYEIPESFNVDAAAIKRKFYEFSKKYHPDFYINEPEEKQQEILELSTLNNKAYQVLSNPAKRMEYMLGLYGQVAEGEKYQLPQDFLMEMMEVNEALMELEFEPEAAAVTTISQQVNAIEDDLKNELKTLSNQFDNAVETEKQSILLKIKDLWYRQKYLLRIRDSLNKFVPKGFQ